MMNKYPAWKYLLVLGVILVGGLYALPNLYGEDPVLQVSLRSGSIDHDTLTTEIDSILKNSSITDYTIEQQDNNLLVRFKDQDFQLSARDLLSDQAGLGENYIVAQNLLPATPAWLQAINARPMYLGLDLRGGIHFLMEIDMDTAVSQAYERYQSEMRTFMRERKVPYKGITIRVGKLDIRFESEQDRTATMSDLSRQYPDLVFSTSEDARFAFLHASLSEAAIQLEREAALEQNLTVLRNRVNELGVAEPIIQQQGTDRIVVQLPGVQDSTKAKTIIGSTATLEYRLVTGTPADWDAAASGGRVPVNARLYKERDGGPILLERDVIVTGDQIKGASAGFDQQSGSPAVFVNLDGKGATKMTKVSSANIGKPMAVVYIEVIDGKRREEVINVATIRDVLNNRFQTTGLGVDEARDLALLLRAGALRAPMKIIEERTVGPSLGKDNIEQGRMSVMIGFVLVLIFMAIYYKAFGMAANIALLANLVILVAVLSLLQATLTLPGIAGIVLTVGMAVDANVLIFERIREELRNGNSVQASIHSGYERALTTIADANITTFIAAVVLLGFGTGPIKGFAWTLSIGIATSMFTAIMGTRALVNLIYGGRRVSRLAI